MKITLIGGSGFVGTRLLDLLGQKNYDLINSKVIFFQMSLF